MAARRLPGLHAVYRPKDRTRVLTFTMTDTGHRALRKLLDRSAMSRADLLEHLIRKEAGEQTAQ